MNPFALPTKTLVALSLAIGLGGCAGLPGLLAGTGMGLTGQGAIDAGAALTADALAAVNADEEMDRGAAVAEAASYTAQSLEAGAETGASLGTTAGASGGTEAGAAASGSLEATASIGSGLELRMARLKERAKAQIEFLRRIVEIKPPETTTHGDGSVTTKYELTITRRNSTTHEVYVKTVAADGHLLKAHYEVERTNKTGHKLTIHREREVRADGTWSGTFESKLTRKDGKEKTVKWTVVGALDGSEKAEGTITRFDGTVVTIAITRTADGTVTVITRDTTARISTEAKKTELDTTAEVKVVSDADGKTVETVKISDTTEVEDSDR